MSQTDTTAISVAWISRGRLFVQTAGMPLKEIESDFAKQALTREMRDSQANAWKGRSGVWGNLGMQPPGIAPWEDADPRRQIRFVTVAVGETTDEIFYTLDMGAVGGLFSYNMRTDIERRLVHRQGFVLRDLSRHRKDGELALSLPREDGTGGLKITRPDGLYGRDVALSDSLDESPSWLHDDSKKLVFQSAAIGRNEHGYIVGKSEYRIELLDLESEELKTLHEEAGFDLLQPRMMPDGSLVFIRRPYQHQQTQKSVSFVDALMDVLLFPYRLLRTFVYFFNFMSMMFAGKPLISAGGPLSAKKQANPYLMLWGQAVDTQKVLNQDRDGSAKKPLVPKEWQLIRRQPDGSEVKLADNVLSWSACRAGTIAWTDGRSLYRLKSDRQSEVIANADLIERIAVLS